MALSQDASKYCEELFEARRTALLREREKQRIAVRQGLTNFEDAARRAGYPGILQPDIDYALALGRARADARRKAYEWDGQEIGEATAAEIMVEAGSVLQQSLGGLMAGERGRMALLAQRTRKLDPAASAKLGELSRHIKRTVCDAQNSIRNDLNLWMLEQRKIV